MPAPPIGGLLVIYFIGNSCPASVAYHAQVAEATATGLSTSMRYSMPRFRPVRSSSFATNTLHRPLWYGFQHRIVSVYMAELRRHNNFHNGSDVTNYFRSDSRRNMACDHISAATVLPYCPLQLHNSGCLFSAPCNNAIQCTFSLPVYSVYYCRSMKR